MSYDQIVRAVTTTNGFPDLRDAIRLNSGTLTKGGDLEYGDQTVDEVAVRINQIWAWSEGLRAAAQDRKQRMQDACDAL